MGPVEPAHALDSTQTVFFLNLAVFVYFLTVVENLAVFFASGNETSTHHAVCFASGNETSTHHAVSWPLSEI